MLYLYWIHSEVLAVQDVVALLQDLVALRAKVELLPQVAHVEQFFIMLEEAGGLEVEVSRRPDDKVREPGQTLGLQHARHGDDGGASPAIDEALVRDIVAISKGMRTSSTLCGRYKPSRAPPGSCKSLDRSPR